jgi:hypothetical protein
VRAADYPNALAAAQNASEAAAELLRCVREDPLGIEAEGAFAIAEQTSSQLMALLGNAATSGFRPLRTPNPTSTKHCTPGNRGKLTLRDWYDHQLSDDHVGRLLHGKDDRTRYVSRREADSEFSIEVVSPCFIATPTVGGEVRAHHPG